MLRAHVTVYQPMSHSFSLIELSKAFFFCHVHCLYLPVGFQVSWQAKFQLYTQVMTKLFKVVIIELPNIVYYQGIRNSILAYEVLSNKISCLLFRDLTKSINFLLFREIIYSHNSIRSCSSPFG